MQTAQTLIRHSGLGHVDNWQYKYTMGTCVQQVQQQEPTKYDVQAKNTHTLHKLNQSMTSLSLLGIICHHCYRPKSVCGIRSTVNSAAGDGTGTGAASTTWTGHKVNTLLG